MKKEGEKWQEYKEQREKIEENEFLIENSSVNSESQVDLIENLERIANEEGVSIEIQNQEVKIDKNNSNKDKDKKVEEGVSEGDVVFSLIINGEYDEILDYIYKLENLSYILNIASLDIKTRSAVPNLRSQLQKQEEESQKPLQAEITIYFTPYDEK